MDQKLEILLVEDDVLTCRTFENLILASDDMLLLHATGHALYSKRVSLRFDGKRELRIFCTREAVAEACVQNQTLRLISPNDTQ